MAAQDRNLSYPNHQSRVSADVINVAMSDDQFTKLFRYVERRFDEARQDGADIRGAIGALSAQVRDYHNESLLARTSSINYVTRYYR